MYLYYVTGAVQVFQAFLSFSIPDCLIATETTQGKVLLVKASIL